MQEFPRPELPGFKQMEGNNVKGISGWTAIKSNGGSTAHSWSFKAKNKWWRQLPQVTRLYSPGKTGPGVSPARRSKLCGLRYSDWAQGQWQKITLKPLRYVTLFHEVQSYRIFIFVGFLLTWNFCSLSQGAKLFREKEKQWLQLLIRS